MNDSSAATGSTSRREGTIDTDGSSDRPSAGIQSAGIQSAGNQAAGEQANGDQANYVVVARRYRPQVFEELIGQQHVSQALTQAISSQRVGHAYLFTGARGVGKTSAARILAKALNCAAGTSATPCNQCELCQSVSSGDDIDVLEIDGASNRGIDEIRQLRQNVAVRPSRARYKIYIIDEVHMLTKEAFNALLKTLEEPPEHVKFIFATTEPNKIPITILSRCQRYDFAGIETPAIQARLQQIANAEGVSVEPDALQILAMRAAGSMRDSQSLLEQLLSTGSKSITASDVSTMLGIAPAARLSQLIRPLVERNAAEALRELDASIAEGAEVGQLVDQLLGYFRDVMTQTVGCDPTSLQYALPGQIDEVRQIAEQLGVHTLLAIGQILDHTAARMRVSTQTRTLVEMAIVRICQLENLDELSALIAQLKAGGTAQQRIPGSKKNETPRPSPPVVAASQPAIATSQGVDPESTTESATNPAHPPAESARSLPAVAPADGAPAATAEVAQVAQGNAKPGAQAEKLTVTAPVAASPLVSDPVISDPVNSDPLASNRLASDSVALGSAAPEVSASPAATKTTETPQQDSHAKTDFSDVNLSSENVAEIWKQVLSSLTGMVMDHAAEADKVTVDGQGRLLISFGESFHRDVIERPANRSRLEAALQTVCGTKINFVLGTHQRVGAPAKTAARAPSRRQQQAEIATQPFVKRAMELFDGDPSRLRYVPPGQK